MSVVIPIEYIGITIQVLANVNKNNFFMVLEESINRFFTIYTNDTQKMWSEKDM